MFVSRRDILHLDMDAFFASVEQARRPELREQPVIVGGRRGGRGVVSACSYEARRYGVHSAMPITQAERRCPQAVFLSPDFHAYTAVHRDVMDLLRDFTDLVEVASIDEAYLDVTGSRRLFGPPQAIARRIQQQVWRRHHVTCTLGIGPNRLLAKLAAELAKPAGVGELREADVRGRLRDLPVGVLHGVGPVTCERLRSMGLTTVGTVQDVPFAVLAAVFGSGAHGLRQLAFGRSVAVLRPRRLLPRSVSREHTFDTDVNESGSLRATLLGLADRAVADLRGHDLAARTITIKVRFSTFHTVTRRRTLPRPVGSARVVYRAAAELLDELDVGVRWVRLLGVALGDLRHGAVQLTFDDEWREAALGEAVDRVRARYGFRALTLAGDGLARGRNAGVGAPA